MENIIIMENMGCDAKCVYCVLYCSLWLSYRKSRAMPSFSI